MNDVTKYFTGNAQAQWNQNRLNKLYEILGEGWFPGKHILEVGCGHGNNGRALIEKGADVLLTDGRQLFVDFLLNDGLQAQVLDLNGSWSLNEKFDLVVHWGLLYHLDKWKESLESALKHAPLICLETLVSESNDSTFEMKINEPEDLVLDGNMIHRYDQALHGVGTIMSTENLEEHLASLGASFIRYDDIQLNVDGCAKYSWKYEDGPIDINWRRRFWMIKRRA